MQYLNTNRIFVVYGDASGFPPMNSDITGVLRPFLRHFNYVALECVHQNEKPDAYPAAYAQQAVSTALFAAGNDIAPSLTLRVYDRDLYAIPASSTLPVLEHFEKWKRKDPLQYDPALDGDVWLKIRAIPPAARFYPA